MIRRINATAVTDHMDETIRSRPLVKARVPSLPPGAVHPLLGVTSRNEKKESEE